jgi:hypothetical protein
MCLVLALATACSTVDSSSQDVNRPGTWQVKFERLVDLDGPPYVTTAPAPEYPTRTMHNPTDASSCAPGCSCAFVNATDDEEGDGFESWHAWGGFTETCPDAGTTLDCSAIQFESDSHTTGVCSLAPSSQRYQVTLDRQSYDDIAGKSSSRPPA